MHFTTNPSKVGIGSIAPCCVHDSVVMDGSLRLHNLGVNPPPFFVPCASTLLTGFEESCIQANSFEYAFAKNQTQNLRLSSVKRSRPYPLLFLTMPVVLQMVISWMMQFQPTETTRTHGMCAHYSPPSHLISTYVLPP